MDSGQEESGEAHTISLLEHNYSKSIVASSESAKEEEAMDTSTESGSGGTGSPLITTLDGQADTFESFLLCLLRAFTKQHQLLIKPNDGHEAEQPETEKGTEISPEALNTLSSDQVTTLVTSNSVNFDVVQQILTQKQRQQTSRSGGTGNEPSSDPGPILAEPLAPPILPTALGVVTGGRADTAGGEGESISAFPITPDLLKQLQFQVSELIRSQQISLPPDLTPEQQQQLIRTLLLRQLHVQQASSKETLEGAGGGNGGSTIAELLKGKEGEDGVREKGVGTTNHPEPLAAKSPTLAYPETKVVKEESPPVSSPPSMDSVTQTSPRQLPVVVPSQPLPSTAPSLQTAPPHTSSSDKPSTSSRTGPKRKREATRGKKDKEGEIKKPSMPYNLFFSEVYSTVLAANPKMTFSDCSRIISTMWNAMGSDSKKRYYEEHNRQKEDYKTAMNKKAMEQSQAQQVATALTVPPETTAVELDVGEVKVEAMEVTADGTTISEPKDPSLCVNANCQNPAVFKEDRGKQYCSNVCAVEHCKYVFQSWVAQQRKTKAS